MKIKKNNLRSIHLGLRPAIRNTSHIEDEESTVVNIMWDVAPLYSDLRMLARSMVPTSLVGARQAASASGYSRGLRQSVLSLFFCFPPSCDSEGFKMSPVLFKCSSCSYSCSAISEETASRPSRIVVLRAGSYVWSGDW